MKELTSAKQVIWNFMISEALWWVGEGRVGGVGVARFKIS